MVALRYQKSKHLFIQLLYGTVSLPSRQGCICWYKIVNLIYEGLIFLYLSLHLYTKFFPYLPCHLTFLVYFNGGENLYQWDYCSVLFIVEWTFEFFDLGYIFANRGRWLGLLSYLVASTFLYLYISIISYFYEFVKYYFYFIM